jgi:hypothetical protein
MQLDRCTCAREETRPPQSACDLEALPAGLLLMTVTAASSCPLTYHLLPTYPSKGPLLLYPTAKKGPYINTVADIFVHHWSQIFNLSNRPLWIVLTPACTLVSCNLVPSLTAVRSTGKYLMSILRLAYLGSLLRAVIHADKAPCIQSGGGGGLSKGPDLAVTTCISQAPCTQSGGGDS